MKPKKNNCKLKDKVKKHEQKEDKLYKKLERENKKFEKGIK